MKKLVEKAAAHHSQLMCRHQKLESEEETKATK